MGTTEKTVVMAEPGPGGPGASAAARCESPYPKGRLCAGWSRLRLFCRLTAPASHLVMKTGEDTKLQLVHCASQPVSLPSGAGSPLCPSG